jgi:hypothetical protein
VSKNMGGYNLSCKEHIYHDTKVPHKVGRQFRPLEEQPAAWIVLARFMATQSIWFPNPGNQYSALGLYLSTNDAIGYSYTNAGHSTLLLRAGNAHIVYLRMSRTLLAGSISLLPFPVVDLTRFIPLWHSRGPSRRYRDFISVQYGSRVQDAIRYPSSL